jgi:RNA polymerase sigma factor (sigma-70 family)
MEDGEIVALYWQRSEQAIAETQRKYGGYCYSIAKNILWSAEDSEETVSDTYIGAWNAMPPSRPEQLRTFLGKITRRLALKKLRTQTAEKRGGGETQLVLDELEGCVPAGADVEMQVELRELVRRIDAFLQTLSREERRVKQFRAIIGRSYIPPKFAFGFGQSKVKMMLLRTRGKLLAQLEREEMIV